MSSQTAYTDIERLVGRFKGLSAAARRHYNEDNTRKDFILPLFRALAWDVTDSAEVSAEEKVSRGWEFAADGRTSSSATTASSRSWTRCWRCTARWPKPSAPSTTPAPTWRIARLDREIDGLVYALYGLTAEEIKIVAEK
jgi:hypothetical protein